MSVQRHIWITLIAACGFVALGGPLAAAEPPAGFSEALELVPTDYRHRVVQNLSVAEDNRDELLRAITQAPPEHREAIAFLIANMQAGDLKTLKADFLLSDVALAYEARAKTPWAAAVPAEIFLNDVVPYVNLNERRDDWRKDFVTRFSPLVKDCKTANEAAQVLNKEVFKALNVTYHATKRRKSDQSPYESTEIGFASCTGLSIMLVDACRAVGVPARVTGIPMWMDGSGNHTWVEVWDGQWRFVGAAEPGPLNKTWFNAPAAKADGATPEHRIYAASFRHTDVPFILDWLPGCKDYTAVDVTKYYVQRRALKVSLLDGAGTPAAGTIQVRQDGVLIAQADGPAAEFELAANVDYVVRALPTAAATGESPVESRVHLPLDADASVEVKMMPVPKSQASATNQSESGAKPTAQTSGTSIDDLRRWLAQPRDARPALDSEAFAKTPLTKAQAAEARGLLRESHAAEIRATREKEWSDEAITLDGRTLKLKQRTFGSKPPGGWNLYISMHGGGNAPAKTNDQQWANQITLYEPDHSLVIAPRAPTDTWNLWHEPHIDKLFDRLIEDAVVLGDVNPDRVYLMGYSAGGDGVYQLAPRMADRFAAASMMAGHPNDASPLGLRNIGFAIHVGALDDGYNRNKVAAEWGEKLDKLHEADPDGYAHVVQLHEGRPHWMNKEDAVALEWMAKFTRNITPTRVVWKQSSNVQHDRFYWLAMPAEQAQKDQLVIATRKGQTVEIEKAEGVKTLTVMLNDDMLDLDQPVSITYGGKELYKGVVPRTILSLSRTLDQRSDPRGMFDGSVAVQLDAAK